MIIEGIKFIVVTTMKGVYIIYILDVKASKSQQALETDVCIHVWSSHIARVRINQIRLPILLFVSLTGKINSSLSPFALDNWPRDAGSAVVPFRVSLLISILRLKNLESVGPEPVNLKV